MAKHFVAVCVVCLLCADHLPCKTHIEGLTPVGSTHFGSAEDYLRSGLEFTGIVGANEIWINNEGPTGAADKDLKQTAQSHARRKRHSHSAAAAVDENEVHMNENSRRYMEEIFDRFGNGAAKTMDLSGFEKMLDHLGLKNLLLRADEGLRLQSGNAEQEQEKDGKLNSSCLSPMEFIRRIGTNVATEPNSPQRAKISKREIHSHKTISTSANDLAGVANKFGSAGDVIVRSGTNNSSDSVINGTSNAIVDDGKRAATGQEIDTETMYNLCPILLYHLATPYNGSCLEDGHLKMAHAAAEDHMPANENDRALVWIYASASVLGVSLCGMLGFAVIPCMDKSFYNTMLQFLVALAVGTLAGDALLHLLPHAMMLSMEAAGPEGAHTAMTFKGLVAVVGVIAFFAIERGLTMIAEWRKERQKKQQLPGRVRVMRDPESVSLNNSEKQCKNKYSSYPYCYDEIAMDTKDDHHHHHHQNNHGHSHGHGHSHSHEKKPSASMSTTSLGTGQPFKQNSVLPLAVKAADDAAPLSFDHSQLNHHHETTLPAGPPVIMANNNGTHKSVSKMERLNSIGSNNNNNSADNNTVSTTLDDGSSIESSRMLKPPTKHEESYTVILREHESKHHGHSHTHGHVHSPPGSLSAVAWMVVMGDGLHNFTDGMAIGAAFSNDIAGGFSTAIAVFCHELPHELGDFAVLLKAGMSAKKAVYYNFLSSILSFFGMALGICIGDTPEASAWIFAIAAGLFIYIALVDMVPELTSSHHENCAGSNTLLQVVGMSMGLVIMLMIALNEEDLKSLFTDNSSGHHHHH